MGFKAIPKEVKEQILSWIKNGGVSVKQAAQDHGISDKAIYAWLKKEAASPVSYREYAHIRKQNQQLMELVGKLSLEIEKMKLLKKD